SLTQQGGILLQELARVGILIDVDHCSQKTANAALDLMETLRYPLISSHSGFMDLALGPGPVGPEDYTNEHAYDGHHGRCGVHDVPHESLKTREQVDRLRRLHGMVAPILIQDRVQDAGGVYNNCDGSSRTWAQKLHYAVDRFRGRGVGLAIDRGLLA